MKPIELDVIGIGAWSPTSPSWPAWADALTGGEASPAAASRPVATLLPLAERRRAPDGVAVALTVAREAIDVARQVASIDGIASVFASAHGDLAIVDYLGSTLACDPFALSPTKFHLSVHNAAAGHWSIATRDRAPSTSIAAGEHSVAFGLLEAATIAASEARPVLFVAFETPAVGLLAHAIENRTLFGCALVVAPARAATGTLGVAVESARSMHGECSADVPTSLPPGQVVALLEAFLAGGETRLSWPIGAETTLSVTVRPREGTLPGVDRPVRVSSPGNDCPDPRCHPIPRPDRPVTTS